MPTHHKKERNKEQDIQKIMSNADEIFTTLMGERVEPRRQFIQSHAKYVKNLDI